MSETLLDTAQALLTGYDTALNKQWREEDRAWRKDDLTWRDREAYYHKLSLEHREEDRRWRAEDLEQRALDNAVVLWDRYVESTRRTVEERAEQLKGVSNLAALIAGFELVAFLQFQFSPDQASTGLTLAFGASSAIVVCLNINSMMMCGLIHASILKSGRLYVSEEEEADFIFRCREYALAYVPGDRPPQPRRNFQQHWNLRCENEWRRAFFQFTVGIPVFLINLALASWIHFNYNKTTASVMSGIVGCSLVYFIIANTRWRKHLTSDQHSMLQVTKAQKFPPAGLPFDWHQRPTGPRSMTRLESNLSRSPAAASAGALDRDTSHPHRSANGSATHMGRFSRQTTFSSQGTHSSAQTGDYSQGAAHQQTSASADLKLQINDTPQHRSVSFSLEPAASQQMQASGRVSSRGWSRWVPIWVPAWDRAKPPDEPAAAVEV